MFKKTTALHIACDKNNLLKYGAGPSQIGLRSRRRRCTTLHLAAMKGNLKMMQLLINNGFDLKKLVNAKVIIEFKDSCYFMTVFLILCRDGNVECLDYLLSVCPFVDIDRGIRFSILFGQRSMLKYLITKVYNKKQVASELMRIVVEGAIEDCEMLLQVVVQSKLVEFTFV